MKNTDKPETPAVEAASPQISPTITSHQVVIDLSLAQFAGMNAIASAMGWDLPSLLKVLALSQVDMWSSGDEFVLDREKDFEEFVVDGSAPANTEDGDWMQNLREACADPISRDEWFKRSDERIQKFIDESRDDDRYDPADDWKKG
jgi:hypothetical protein